MSFLELPWSANHRQSIQVTLKTVAKPVTRGSHYPKRPHLSVVHFVKERAFEKQGVERRDYTAYAARVNSPKALGRERSLCETPLVESLLLP